jgi:hypothetical protein
VAVSVLNRTGKKRRGRVLEVVFGPLHHAVTDDRLPHDLWSELGRIAPPASDPALRLRRMLINEARDGDWPRETLERALRGGGPYIKELKTELSADDNYEFAAVARAVLRGWKRFI